MKTQNRPETKKNKEIGQCGTKEIRDQKKQKRPKSSKILNDRQKLTK